MLNHPLSAASFFFADPPASGGVRSGYATPATWQEEMRTIRLQKKGLQIKHKYQKSHHQVPTYVPFCWFCLDQCTGHSVLQRSNALILGWLRGMLLSTSEGRFCRKSTPQHRIEDLEKTLKTAIQPQGSSMGCFGDLIGVNVGFLWSVQLDGEVYP